ncbi:PASTA domain-containing protein [Blattabacterium cuenoti]|uniref:PASTA domain-containing protein n=1 Tax=Blattabacterium cuenoti TaxID=1653831 RepID=UPI00163C8447|nr:PASTA domain-containing protein [Blattabacterium cuenoti]
MNYSKYFVIFIINLLISIFFLYKITRLALKWVDIYTKHGSYVVVPNLRYLTLSQSISILKKLGLKYDLDGLRYNSNLMNNKIISFSPEAGDHVKEGRHIYLQVYSKSKYPTIILPKIINKNKYIAIKLLHDNHIPIKEIKYINDFSKDIVIKIVYENKLIQYGYIFPYNKNQKGITLIIGKGYEKNNLIVPNVIGMSLQSANLILKEKFFHIINFYYDKSIISPDQNAKVYRQKPYPGEIQNKNKSVDLWLTSKEIFDNLKIEKKKEEEKKEEEKKGEEKKGEEKKGEEKKGEEKKGEEKKGEEKKGEEKKGEEKKGEKKKGEEKKGEKKKGEKKKGEKKKGEEKKGEKKKGEKILYLRSK